jgi:hypothetical protein
MALSEVVNAPGFSELEKTAEVHRMVGGHAVLRGLAGPGPDAAADYMPHNPVHAVRWAPGMSTTHVTTATTFRGLTSRNAPKW